MDGERGLTVQGVKVVLADDSPDIRALLRLMLEREGYQVVGEAETGVEAVALAQEHQPQLVVLDVTMPVMDGMEAIPLIKLEAPRAKIVMFSGLDSTGRETSSLAAGADAFLQKGSPDVVAVLARVLDGEGRLSASGEAAAAAAAAVPAPVPAAVGLDLSAIVHQLMGPLTIIEGFATMIEAQGELLSPEEVRGFGGRIARSAVHLRGMIRAAVDAQRLEDGSFRIAPELVDLGPLVSDAVAALSDVTDPHPVEVDADAGFVVDGDPERIRQALACLLSNAAKFSEPYSPIGVEVREGEGVVEVSVRDHGPGIPEEQRGGLFGAYTQLGQAGSGLGIGLFVARGIARAHGGDVRLAPPAPGEGARFVLALPAADASAPA